ncbi:MAG: hypothetical protein ACXV8M_13940, partial [Candidatus Angelobacter sp.]
IEFQDAGGRMLERLRDHYLNISSQQSLIAVILPAVNTSSRDAARRAIMQQIMPEERPATDAGTQDASAASSSPGTVKVETTSSAQGEPMEIHTPDKPIHSKKEFLFHMLTVVLGILIALALDGIVTWGHHRVLVREARANIAIELRNNKETIEKAVPEIQARQKQLQDMISTIDEVEKSRKPSGKPGYNFASYELYSTAWKTASVSGAVTHMEYEQLKDYTDAYDLQQDFLTVQAQGFASVGDLIAATRVLNKDLSKVPQERLEDLQREALKILTIQRTLENVSAGLILAYDKALK